MPQKPSYNSLKECLRCANQEAQGYLNRLNAAGIENEQLRAEVERWKSIGQGADRLCNVLIQALEKSYGIKQ